MLDYSSLSVQELEDVSQAALREIHRRRNETELPEQIERLAGVYQQAIGRVDGDPWVQPTGAHDAYRQNATVTHNDKVWRSTTPANVWEPGTSGWREVTGDEEGTVPAEWMQPSGVHDAYNTGDRVTFEGEVWESVIDVNTWSPSAHPQGWKKVDEPVEDEPVPDFVQPTGGHDAYNTGDRVTFEGEVWESTIDGNIWSPTDYPTGWKKVDEPVNEPEPVGDAGGQNTNTQDEDVV